MPFWRHKYRCDPHHISFMALLAMRNDTKERNLLMKIIFADIILLWMRILTCVEYPKTSKQNCILHGSVFVFLYIITVESSSLSYAFQHFQSCSVLSTAEQLSSLICTPGGWYV